MQVNCICQKVDRAEPATYSCISFATDKVKLFFILFFSQSYHEDTERCYCLASPPLTLGCQISPDVRCKCTGSLFSLSFSGFHLSSVLPHYSGSQFPSAPSIPALYTLNFSPMPSPRTHSSSSSPLSPVGNNLGYDSPTSVSPRATFNIKLATSNIRATWNSREMPVLRLVCF